VADKKAGGLEELVGNLRADLANGSYHPRERLVEADLVERYRTSRAVVREALFQLAAEGLVERLPNRGARVSTMTVEEAIEIAEVRRLIETLCAGRAALASRRDRADFARIAAEVQAAAESGSIDAFLTANASFHAKISAMAKHRLAERILALYRNRPIDRSLPHPFRSRPPMASAHEHQKIAAAIAAGDSAAASDAMYERLTTLIELLQAYSVQDPHNGDLHEVD
jgi:DNA-binding GntR family transcriptional regulator